MTEDEIEGLAEEIRSEKRKEINLAYEKSKKLLQSMQKHSESMKEGCKKLIEETEPKLTEEGMKKIKFRSQFESHKAINGLAHYIDENYSDFSVPDASQKLTSVELTQFIRSVSRMLNEINRECIKADRIMGIDFALKKRSIYSPLSKLGSELSKLRDLQKEEYRIIKTLEDLVSLEKDVQDLSEQISQTKESINLLQDEYKALKEAKAEVEENYTLLLENPLIQNSRNHGIRMTEVEIEIGKHLNSFKKIFKKYAREIQRGSISGEFGFVNTALAYEKNPVQSFLEEEEGNPEIIALMEELLTVGESDLHLKQKSINNLTQELKALQQGKMDSWKKEWNEHLKRKEDIDKSSEFQSINKKLTQCETEITSLTESLNLKEEEINLNTKKLNQLSDSLIERRQRAKDITTELLETKN
ncbi:MAG: hypothetical protein ACFFB2_07135 [Promethearchaeota archaeon]